MATNDFYYGNRPPSTGPSQHQQQQPYYGGFVPSPSSTPAPSYTTNAPANHQQPPRNNTVSPFDTVFDDPRYAQDSTQNGFQYNGNNNNNNNNGYYGGAYGGGGTPSEYSSYNNMQSTAPAPYGNQDTGYYGAQHSPSPASTNRPPQAHFADDIPLQDQAYASSQNQPLQQGPKDAEMNDHVYDAPGASTARRSKSKKVGFGQLGMFGADKKRIPFICYILTIAQIGTFIGMIARNAVLTGSPIMIKPSFNPMIGPSYYVSINMGARYVPCMRRSDAIEDAIADFEQPLTWPCPNTTTDDSQSDSNMCTLGELCGFGGVPDPSDDSDSGEPNQWFRFIVPIFLHAGLIHIAINMLVQLTIAKDMERAIGSVRFAIVYISAGIFGNILGGNFAGEGMPSTGASGALFGIIALTLLDLLYSWKDRRHPVKDLMFILLDVIVCFVLGLLPGLDNFAHIGGFLMGLCLGVSVLHSPNSLRRRMGSDTSYTAVNAEANRDGGAAFLKSPAGFFKGRKPLWWAWWFVRAAFLVTVVTVFFVLLDQFYKNESNCDWCKYLSCIPVKDWCEMGELEFKSTDGSSN